MTWSMTDYHMVMVMILMQCCYVGWRSMVDDRMVVAGIECSCCCCCIVAAAFHHHCRCTTRHCCSSHQIHRNSSHHRWHHRTNFGVTLMNKNTCCVLADDGEIEVEDAGYSYCCYCGRLMELAERLTTPLQAILEQLEAADELLACI